MNTDNKERKKDYVKNGIIVALSIGVLGAWGSLVWQKGQHAQDVIVLNTRMESVDASKKETQALYGAALVRLDSLTGSNAKLKNIIASDKSKISKLKKQIEELLKKQTLTEEEKKVAEAMIVQLNTIIESLKVETEKLKEEKKKLEIDFAAEVEKTVALTALVDSSNRVNDQLESVIEVGSTLNAYDISVKPVVERKRGEKETLSAKRVDKLKVYFYVENRIASSGTTDVYATVSDPFGKPFENGTFQLRDGSSNPYTAKLTIDYEAGKKKIMSFDLSPDHKFSKGEYSIKVYHNGFEIGSSVVKLK